MNNRFKVFALALSCVMLPLYANPDAHKPPMESTPAAHLKFLNTINESLFVDTKKLVSLEAAIETLMNALINNDGKSIESFRALLEKCCGALKLKISATQNLINAITALINQPDEKTRRKMQEAYEKFESVSREEMMLPLNEYKMRTEIESLKKEVTTLRVALSNAKSRRDGFFDTALKYSAGTIVVAAGIIGLIRMWETSIIAGGFRR
jgi:hypothetical protein